MSSPSKSAMKNPSPLKGRVPVIVKPLAIIPPEDTPEEKVTEEEPDIQLSKPKQEEEFDDVEKADVDQPGDEEDKPVVEDVGESSEKALEPALAKGKKEEHGHYSSDEVAEDSTL